MEVIFIINGSSFILFWIIHYLEKLGVHVSYCRKFASKKILTLIENEQNIRKPVTRYGFEEQLIGEYTRNVYSVFRERLWHSTAFRIKQSREDPRNYLVHHHNKSRVFAWSRHEFHVTADEEEGDFRCECKLWEHTGTHSLSLSLVDVKMFKPKTIYTDGNQEVHCLKVVMSLNVYYA